MGSPDGESPVCTFCGDEATIAERVAIGLTEGQFCEDCLRVLAENGLYIVVKPPVSPTVSVPPQQKKEG